MSLVPDDHLRLVFLVPHGKEAPGETVITVSHRRPRRPQRPSVIEAMPSDEEEYINHCVAAVVGLLRGKVPGSIFLGRDNDEVYRVTIERCKAGEA